MIVRAKTPQRLSLAGRLAIVALAALLLPLAPSWAQRDPSATSPVESDRPAPGANGTLVASLKDETTKLNAAIDKKRAELEELVEKGTVGVTDQQYDQTSNRLLQVEMELLESQVMLEAAQSQLEKLQTPQSQKRLEVQVKEEFRRDPEAIALADKIKETQNELEKVKSVIRNANDPATSGDREATRETE